MLDNNLNPQDVEKARKILTEAGMNKEVMENKLKWDEFVSEVLYRPNAAKEWDEHSKSIDGKGIDDWFSAMTFAMYLTTD